MSRRIEKINKLLKQEVGKAILNNLDFRKGTMVTVTQVYTSSDLSQAKVKISIIPFVNAEEILKIIKNHKGLLQKTISQKLEMKKVPKIKFDLDKTEQKAQRVEQLIKQIHKND